MANVFSLPDVMEAVDRSKLSRQNQQLNALRIEGQRSQNAMLPDPWTALLEREDDGHTLQ